MKWREELDNKAKIKYKAKRDDGTLDFKRAKLVEIKEKLRAASRDDARVTVMVSLFDTIIELYESGNVDFIMFNGEPVFALQSDMIDGKIIPGQGTWSFDVRRYIKL